MNDNIQTAPNWPDYDTWLGELRKELASRGTAIPSQREIGVALFHGGIDVLAGRLTCSNQMGWFWDPAIIAKAALWVSDHLPQIVIQQKHWEREILAGTRSVFQVISIGTLRSRAEVPLTEVFAAVVEHRFPVWRFDVVRCSIYNFDLLLTDEVEKWALETAARVTQERVKGAMA
ncbi:MAG: hypothetical protein WCO91_12255 [Gemmataceae bacterium]